MLDLQWEDVLVMIESLAPQLTVVGVALVIGIVVTLAINARTVKRPATRKVVRASTWVAVGLACVVAINSMLYGPLNTVLSLISGEGTLSEETIERASDLTERIEGEGIVLLKNDGDALPLDGTNKINVFGWGSTNGVYGGVGSGSVSDTYPITSLLDGLHNAGFETNDELTQLYVDYRADRPAVTPRAQDWTVPEVPVADYSEELLANAREFSDTAVVVITRVGGEGADLPKDVASITVHGEDNVDATAYEQETGNTYEKYINNSSEYDDFEEGQHILELSRTEREMLEMVCENFDDVVLVYNGANTFELGFIDEMPNIKAALWVPPAGQTGFNALGEILSGAINPSGRISDTFAADFTQSPSYNNFGEFIYENMDEFAAGGFRSRPTVPSFVNYTDGIYVGYRFWETAADEGLIDYDESVVYPFGYGLSYTTFSQEMGEMSVEDGTVSFDVTVTNTGDVAGKDVVQVYYNPPYVNGGLEKASANLVAFDKTEELAPGASETVHVEFNVEDMASYDSSAADGAGAYVLEAGDYVISVNANSHEEIASQTWTLDETITYDEANPRSTDEVVASNEFSDVEGEGITYLSRADGFANFEEATAAPTDFTLSDELKATFVNNSNYDPAAYDDASDEMPVTGAEGDLTLADLYGLDYDDPAWDQLLDQLTFEEMDTLIASGGYGNAAIESIGKAYQYDLDGPAALNNNFTGVGSIGFPSSTSVACTWNADLALEYGQVIGDMAQEMDTTGWYAPAVNIHRSPFGGRTFEYFSEDPLLTGRIAAREVEGAKEKGVYAYVKHFALNEQETNRESMLCTWANEQSIREVYLRPFELTVKEGGTTAIMSSFNYVGTVYSGGSSALLKDVLRGEWGFRGAVITDYYGGFGYQNADQCIRNGNDLMLASTDTTNHITDDSATSVQAMREAAHNILYMAGNSWKYAEGDPVAATPAWQWVDYVVTGVAVVALLLCEAVAIKRFRSRRQVA